MRALFLLNLYACTADKSESGDSSPILHDDTQDDSSAHSGASGDSHSGDVHSGDTHTGETGPPPIPDFVEVALDRVTHEQDGFEIATFELNPEADAQYGSLFEGQRPMFYFGRPTTPMEGPVPFLIWVHGGALGDDSSGDLPAGCTEEAVTGYADKTVENDFLPLVLAARAGWGFVIPRNDWCDFWTGLGPDDPVDPEHHHGYRHFERVLDFVRTGQAGLDNDGTLYGWGTSSGGGAVIHASARYGGFAGIIADSAPSSMLLYYEGDPTPLEHIFGGAPYDEAGAPTESWQRYADASSEWLVEDGGYRVPVYVTWNTQDTLIAPTQPSRLQEALATVYEPLGLNWGGHDFDHPAPGAQHHTQSKWPQVPWGYTGVALNAFLSGKRVSWIEAEDGCDGADAGECTVGALVTGTVDTEFEAGFSGATARESRAAEGSGVLWQDHLPDDLPTGTTITASFVMAARGIDDEPAGTPVATLTWSEGSASASRLLTVSDFAPESDATHDQTLHQYNTTTLDLTVTTAGVGTLAVRSHGLGRLAMDAIIFSW